MLIHTNYIIHLVTGVLRSTTTPPFDDASKSDVLLVHSLDPIAAAFLPPICNNISIHVQQLLLIHVCCSRPSGPTPFNLVSEILFCDFLLAPVTQFSVFELVFLIFWVIYHSIVIRLVNASTNVRPVNRQCMYLPSSLENDTVIPDLLSHRKKPGRLPGKYD
jgi:hypothetical protein